MSVNEHKNQEIKSQTTIPNMPNIEKTKPNVTDRTNKKTSNISKITLLLFVSMFYVYVSPFYLKVLVSYFTIISVMNYDSDLKKVIMCEFHNLSNELLIISSFLKNKIKYLNEHF